MTAAQALSGSHIRVATEADENFIRSSWKRSFETTAKKMFPKALFGGGTRRDMYFPEMEAVINDILRRGAELRVLSDDEDPNYIEGWACVEGPVVHFVYVKQVLRRLGRAAAMVEHVPRPILCTHWTPWCSEIEAAKPGTLRYAPERLRP